MNFQSPFLIRLVPLCMVLCGWIPLLANSQESPPSIVFSYADDMGFGDLACHGHPRISTPHLDQMAADGTDFHQFTVVNPVRSPSRAAILTGLFPSRLGIHQHFAGHALNVERGMPDWLDPEVACLPRILHDHGYRTAHYGRWHLTSGGITDSPPIADYGYDDAATLPTSIDPKLQTRKASSADAPKTERYRSVSSNGTKSPLSSQQRARIFGIKDSNQDDLLSLEEFSTRLPDEGEAKRRFAIFDKDQNGSLTLDEFAAAGRQDAQ